MQKGYLLFWSVEDAGVEVMLSPLEGVLSGMVSSCSAGQRIVTLEAAGSAAHCLWPVESLTAMTAVTVAIARKHTKQGTDKDKW